MSKKQKFIDAIAEVYFSKVNIEDIDPDIIDYWEALKGKEDKPEFTDNGKLILKYMQEQYAERDMLKSKDIADGLMMSSRGVSGAMRKLVTDGYVERIGDSPVIYSITEKGKNANID